ncbi:aspartate/glutamate racemase family protein [Halomonas salipaludis]|uniref:Asp/Glu/hydantoin racemase n=1 Tax=Halomonas salipaludis TaxID=2032625 RepID=A0A2A2EY08_9GAMM|nr:aspartate/glutamate racemase family protein [Halomonas salipaludis]PAU78281.1 Asp/Glu/hydantoin racemase [Halomonas salipaludis]
MRLLVINPNSSSGVTRHIGGAARLAALPGDEIVVTQADGAPPLIVDDGDARLAEQAVVDTVLAMGNGFDGIIVASFGDTGAAALRRVVDCPVVGIGHASLLTASALGGPFAVVSFATAVVPAMQQLVESYGMQGGLSGIHVVDLPLPEDPGEIQSALAGPLRERCREVAARNECRSIILGGGPLAGLALRLAPSLPLPVIDATVAAVQLQRSLQFSRGGGPAQQASDWQNRPLSTNGTH